MASLIFSIVLFGVQCLVLLASALLLVGVVVSVIFGGAR